jgi:ribosomal protein L35AE/L33A
MLSFLYGFKKIRNQNNRDRTRKKNMSNWNWRTKLKTNKISIKRSKKILEIKRIRIEIEIVNKKGQTHIFLGRERKERKKIKGQLMTNGHINDYTCRTWWKRMRWRVQWHDQRACSVIGRCLTHCSKGMASPTRWRMVSTRW